MRYQNGCALTEYPTNGLEADGVAVLVGALDETVDPGAEVAGALECEETVVGTLAPGLWGHRQRTR